MPRIKKYENELINLKNQGLSNNETADKFGLLPLSLLIANLN